MPTQAVEGTTRTRDLAAGASRSRDSRARRGSDAAVVLGRYRLGRRLGTGAFGTVYAARDERLERDVAVKVLPRERVIGGRFEREARAAARLQHPAIVTLYEAVVDDEDAYLVSELVRGRTLDAMLESGHLSDRTILEIGVSLCDALAHAHEQGVIHRDVKPSNILIPARPASPHHLAKLTDFGVATVVGGDSLTRTGDVVGTAAYMAPEQADGREVTPAADLYALALVVYEALTGVNPLAQSRIQPRPARRLATYLPPLRRQRRDLPRDLGAGVDRALRPRPAERGTLEELRAGLAAALPQVSDRTGVVVPRWRRHDQEAGAVSATDVKAGGMVPPLEPGRSRPRLPLSRRLPAGAAAGAAVAWASIHVLGATPIPPLMAAVITAAVVVLLPRLGWLTCSSTVALVAVAQSRPGAGLVFLLAVAAATACLLPCRELWPLPAGAVALGLIGLGGAWPALVAMGALRRRPLPRAALAAAGYLWLVAAGALGGHRLYWLPAHLPGPAVFGGSLQSAVQDVVQPIVTAPALAGALAWAAAALVLPWLARGRSLIADSVVVAVWSATVVATVAALAPAAPVRGAAQGAVAAAVVALIPAARAGLMAGGGPTKSSVA
jgi:hypothetical protein